jgi:hypothetical protein
MTPAVPRPPSVSVIESDEIDSGEEEHMTTAPVHPDHPPAPGPAGSAGWPGEVDRFAWGSRGVVATLGSSLVAIAAADVLNPQYNPLSEAVSRYVHGTAGWLITAAILGMGLGSAALVAMLGRLTGLSIGGRIGRRALAVWAAGALVASAFPADPPGRSAHPSTSELVHGMAAWVAFAAFPLAAVLLARALSARLSARMRSGRGWLAGTAAVSAVATAALVVFLADVMDGPSLGIGGVPTLLGAVERLVIVANLAWLALAAVAVARIAGTGAVPRRGPA